MRHHAARLRFERLADEWFAVVDPDFYFTKDGFEPHRFPEALLAGKKRLERNAAVRSQVVMWQHPLIESGKRPAGLFDAATPAPLLEFERLPLINLSRLCLNPRGIAPIRVRRRWRRLTSSKKGESDDLQSACLRRAHARIR